MLRRPLVPLAVTLAVGALLYAETRRYGLLGFDTYPLILTSRVQAWGDLAGNFTERLMDGRYAGAFYRPVLNLTFALDYAVWRLDPWGYQLTNVILFCATALLLWALTLRLAGGSAIAALAALGTFLVQPTHFEVLPVPSRRPELLCCAFMLLALLLQLRRLGPAWLPAAATALAIASKESGFVLPPLILLAVLLYSERPSFLARAKQALAASIPHLAAAGAMLAVRLAILGGLGGHGSAGPPQLSSLLVGLVLPQPVMRRSAAAVALPLAIALGLAGSLLVDRRRVSAEGRAILVASAWIAAVGLAYAAAGRLDPWYFLLPTAGWSMLAGTLVASLAGRARSGTPLGRSLATATLALLGLLLLWQARFSPLVQHYDEWERATRVEAAFLDETAERMARAPAGSVVETPPLPVWVRPKTDAPTVSGAAILADYSVQAWSELTFPAHNVELRITRRLDGY